MTPQSQGVGIPTSQLRESSKSSVTTSQSDVASSESNKHYEVWQNKSQRTRRREVVEVKTQPVVRRQLNRQSVRTRENISQTVRPSERQN